MVQIQLKMKTRITTIPKRFKLTPLLLLGVFLAVALVSASNDSNQTIGGDKDEHGCLIAAGYSWCEPRDKCLKSFEEICPKTLEDYQNLTYQQENYIKELNKTIDRKDFGIMVVNNNIAECQEARRSLMNNQKYAGFGILGIVILILVISIIKRLRRRANESR